MLLFFLLKKLMISFYNYFCCVLSSLDIVYNFCFPFLWFQSCDLLKISFRISVLWFWQFIKVCLGLFQRSPAPSGGMVSFCHYDLSVIDTLPHSLWTHSKYKTLWLLLFCKPIGECGGVYVTDNELECRRWRRRSRFSSLGKLNLRDWQRKQRFVCFILSLYIDIYRVPNQYTFLCTLMHAPSWLHIHTF